uniref:ARAD1C04180p n=1 Tax=Blastobotrys adeninivorans TaxID=409370 RepID=A0A060SZY3_BLAAD
MVQVDAIGLIQFVGYNLYRATAPLWAVLRANPDLGSVLITLLILYVSLLIIQHTTRMMYRALMTMIRVIVFMVILLGVFWISVRGIDGVYEQVANIPIDTTVTMMRIRQVGQLVLSYIKQFEDQLNSA